MESTLHRPPSAATDCDHNCSQLSGSNQDRDGHRDSDDRLRAAPPSTTVTLPVEVIGPNGTTVSSFGNRSQWREPERSTQPVDANPRIAL